MRQRQYTRFERWFTRIFGEYVLHWVRVLSWSVIGYSPLDRYLELKASRSLILIFHLVLAACDFGFYFVARLYEQQPRVFSLSAVAIRLRLLLLIAGLAVTWFRSVAGSRP